VNKDEYIQCLSMHNLWAPGLASCIAGSIRPVVSKYVAVYGWIRLKSAVNELLLLLTSAAFFPSSGEGPL